MKREGRKEREENEDEKGEWEARERRRIVEGRRREGEEGREKISKEMKGKERGVEKNK